MAYSCLASSPVFRPANVAERIVATPMPMRMRAAPRKPQSMLKSSRRSMAIGS
jgi:hypothetical protein